MKSLSPLAQKLVVSLAQDEGRKRGSTQLLPEHVILAMLKTAEGIGYALLQELNINVLTYQLSLEQSITPYATGADSYSELPPSKRLRMMLDAASIESRSLKDDYVGTEHIMIASMREMQSITFRYFEKAGVSVQDALTALPNVKRRVVSSASIKKAQEIANSVFGEILGFDNPVTQNDKNSFQRNPNMRQENKSFLLEYSRNLTDEASLGKEDPVVGRENEIRRVIQILSRRTKNNPLLLGAPGVGKTAIVEGLAQKIASGKVPFNLSKKRILSLDLTALIAGTKYRGEFEERIKRIMKEVKDNKNTILFIDEMHTLIGAGGPEGSMDASNMLKPALSRGEIQIIGATTIKEYRKYMEKDAALARRFQTVSVEEPSDEETTLILEGIKKKYEDFHNVSYEQDVIPAIIRFSHRYIPERCLPDKAIDILDEAGAEKKIQDDSRPKEFDELEKNINNLIEEKKLLVQNQDYEKAALVRDKVKELKEKLLMYSSYWTQNESERKKVSISDVCKIISSMTKIPLEHLDSKESVRLVHMEDELHKTVIGQNDAIKLISGAVRRSRAGIGSGKKPIGSFVFLGPTGVGKTQLAKTLAKFMFGSEDSLIRIDMSDYMEKHNASRLVGAPPGYVGYEEGGVLTEKVRTHPYSIILLDEIEKAHSDVFNLLLQLLEEGELSDNLGHAVNFRNTVIIMTSNAGAREITTEGRVGFSNIGKENLLSYDEIKSSAMLELKKIMSPELLNRIDDVVVFNALDRVQVNEILNLQLSDLAERLLEKDLALLVKTAAREYMIDNGYDPSFGARPIRRMIQKEIEDPLAIMILDGEYKNGSTVVIDKDENGLTLKFKKNKKNSVKAKTKLALIEAESQVK